MKLCPRELDSLLVHQAGFLAQKRLARGIKLNYPEAVALIGCQVQELIRDGVNSVADLMERCREILGYNQVMAGVTEMISEVEIEATFQDGTKLVTVHGPINRENGNLELALYGSFLPVPHTDVFIKEELCDNATLNPGEVIPVSEDPIVLNAGRNTKVLTVVSKCDRPIQIGSHYHFIETNKYLEFDREQSYGMRLNIASGTSIRFEPGDTKKVPLVEIEGNRVIRGGNNLCDGPVDPSKLPAIMEKIQKLGFGDKKEPDAGKTPSEPCTISRINYIHQFGPSVGDKIRLGDTSLIIEVEKDMTVYGEECKFGGGKVLREGMGQAALISNEKALDTLITNALIVDANLGIIKADVGIKDGIIVGIGKAGNPDVMPNIDSKLIFGVGTEAIAGEGLILTAGGIDSHVHFICPQLSTTAIASGLTTLVGGGTGPATGTCATTCSPGPNHIKHMIQSTDCFPLNFGFTGKGNTSRTQGEAQELIEQINAGAIGLKLHEDWGTTPASIDAALNLAEQYDVQITIHTDTLNESGCVEDSIAAFKGRTIHTYHSEGAGGGHAPDIIRVCGETNVLPSSTNPTKPYTKNTVDEHLDMLIVCHHLDRHLKEDLAFAESRIRAETMAAEDILHDIGAISMMSSDSQAMGRIGEVITRTWQTADKMKQFRGKLPEEKGDNDNFRVRRYVAKYTINPAISHGMAHLIGSVEVGKVADLVLWHPAFFGAKPELILKSGYIAWAQMGMPNASISTPEPVKSRKMFGAYGKAIKTNSIIFVSQAAVVSGTLNDYSIIKRVEAVKGCRNLQKKDMVLNDISPVISVDPQTFKVRAKYKKGQEEIEELLDCPPAKSLCLTQRYFLF